MFTATQYISCVPKHFLLLITWKGTNHLIDFPHDLGMSIPVAQKCRICQNKQQNIDFYVVASVIPLGNLLYLSQKYNTCSKICEIIFIDCCLVAVLSKYRMVAIGQIQIHSENTGVFNNLYLQRARTVTLATSVRKTFRNMWRQRESPSC